MSCRTVSPLSSSLVIPPPAKASPLWQPSRVYPFHVASRLPFPRRVASTLSTSCRVYPLFQLLFSHLNAIASSLLDSLAAPPSSVSSSSSYLLSSSSPSPAEDCIFMFVCQYARIIRTYAIPRLRLLCIAFLCASISMYAPCICMHLSLTYMSTQLRTMNFPC